MSITLQDIEQFQDYAKSKLASGEADLTWKELFQGWLSKHPSQPEREEVNAIIEQGVIDLDAGRSLPAEQVHEELRQKHKLS